MGITDREVAVAALFVAVVSGAVSAWAARRSVRIASDQTSLQGQMLRLEQARERARIATAVRAVVRATLTTKGSVFLSVYNESDVEARMVGITVDGETVQQARPLQCATSVGRLGCRRGHRAPHAHI